MKFIKKPQAIVFAIIYLFVILYPAQLSCEEKVSDIFHDFFQKFIDFYPEWGVEIGITKEMGYDVRRDALNDVSYGTALKEIEMYEDILARLERMDSSKITSSEKNDRDVLKWYLEIMIEKKEFLNHDYLLSHMFDVPLQTVTGLVEYHQISSKKDAEDYLRKLSLIDSKMKTLEERIQMQEKEGIIPPKCIFERIDKTIQNQIPDTLKKSELYVSFKRKLDSSVLSDKEKKNFLSKAEKILKEEFYPAMKEYRSFVTEIAKKADNNAGVWKLNDGVKFYEWCLKYHTTTDMTAAEIHEKGMSEVKRIQSEIMRLYVTLGVDTVKGYGDATEIYWKMTEDSASQWDMFYEDSDKGREEVIRDYNKIIEEVYPVLNAVFSELPESKVKVEKNPDYKSASAGAYYIWADLQKTRPGIFYINLSWLPDKPSMQTLTYHETVPGHHLQIALQQEDGEMHIMRNAIFCTSYIEGWALYAEQLADETNLFTNVHSKISYLQSELFRAARLVLDTGIHAMKWTREEAALYMKKNLGWAGYGEIDRYIVWPGQACAYKIGELKLVELREMMKERMKKDFDIRDFHDIVLKSGPVPLNMLEERIKEEIK
ncbi:MAG: DUF885 domain-containing protein [bacterium]|nr:DUF885 domain-containing protein [bacterium]